MTGEQLRGELVRYDLSTGQFVTYLSGISAEHLDFSRDGKWVTYIDYPEGNLWRSRLDGSQRLQLTFPPMRAVLPRWSPDGKKIAFYAIAPGKTWKSYIIPAEGGSLRQLVLDDHSEIDPGWSPDGNQIVFGRPMWVETELPTMAIHLLDLRTNQISTLPGSRGLWSPRWSPNGRYIIGLTVDGQKMMLFDFTTGEWVELIIGSIGHRNWSRDGKYLYYDNRLGNDPSIFRISIGARKIERVASLKELPLAYGFFLPWTGLAPDNSPLLVRDAGNREIYALDWEAP